MNRVGAGDVRAGGQVVRQGRLGTRVHWPLLLAVGCASLMTSCGGDSDRVHALEGSAGVTVLVKAYPTQVAGVGFSGTFAVHDGCLTLDVVPYGGHPPPGRVGAPLRTLAILPEGTRVVSHDPLVLEAPHVGRVAIGEGYALGGIAFIGVPAIGHCPAGLADYLTGD